MMMIIDHDENNQEERIVSAKISLKEAHSFLDKEVIILLHHKHLTSSKGSSFQLISYIPSQMFGKKTWIF